MGPGFESQLPSQLKTQDFSCVFNFVKIRYLHASKRKSFISSNSSVKTPDRLGTAPIALYYFWNHKLFLGLLILLIPPFIMSYILITFVNLEKLKASAFGIYISKHMTTAMQTVRLFGMLVSVVGAWFHYGWLIIVGLFIILFGWFWGKLKNML